MSRASTTAGANLPLRLLITLPAALLALLLATAHAALLLASLGRYHLWPCLIAGTIIATITALSLWRLPLAKNHHHSCAIAALLLSALATFCLTTPASEMLLGGWDPGVYLQTAAAIADGGSLTIEARDLYQLPPDLNNALSRNYAGWRHHFMGMFPWPEGRLLPQFMHLYPALMAPAYSIAGLKGALMVNPLLNIFAILALYWLASSIAGPLWGLLAALLLAINPAQLWQAHFSTSEMLCQVVLTSAAAASIEFSRKASSPWWGALTGLLLGLAVLTRYDTILLVVPLLPLLLVGKFTSRAEWPSVAALCAALLLTGCHAWWHLQVVAPCYRPLPSLVFPLLRVALLLTLLLIIALHFKVAQHLRHTLLLHQKWLRLALLLLFTALALFIAYLRPRLTLDGSVSRLLTPLFNRTNLHNLHTFLAGSEAFNIRYLTAIMTPPGLLLATTGIALMIWQRHLPGLLPWLTAAILTTATLLIHSFCDHFMMWMSRRFIPVTLPLLLCGTVYALHSLHHWSAKLLPRRQTPERLLRTAHTVLPALLPLALLLLMLRTMLPATAFIARHRDWPGLNDWYDTLNRHIPDDALLFCDQPGFAAPLRFFYHRNAYEIHHKKSCADFAREHRARLARLERPLLFLTMGKPVAEAISEIPHPLTSHTLERPATAIPQRLRKRGGAFVLYTVDYSTVITGTSGHLDQPLQKTH